MLILTRREGETITISVPEYKLPVTVTVLEVNGRQARLGIEADYEILINRSEVTERDNELWTCCDRRLIGFPIPHIPLWNHCTVRSCPVCGRSYLLAQKTTDSPYERFELPEEYTFNDLLAVWNIQIPSDLRELPNQINLHSQKKLFNLEQHTALQNAIRSILSGANST